MTDYEKIYAINQYMVDNVTYDFSNRGLWDAFLYKKGFVILSHIVPDCFLKKQELKVYTL